VELDREAHLVSAAPAVPVPAAAPAAPAPAAAAAPAGEAWSGTVQLAAANGDTEFMGPGSVRGGAAALYHAGRRVELRTLPFAIGRVGCQYIVDDPKVSRRHATILRENGTYLLRDENSRNHTYLDGVMLSPYTPVPLKDGCVIRMGGQEFRFAAEGA
jgi:hypothetical protein